MHHLPLTTCDYRDAARHIAALLGRPAPKQILLIADDPSLLRRCLKPLLSQTAWTVDGVSGVRAYPDRSFDSVVVLDSVAALPRAERAGVVAEALRVAGRTAIIAAPLGTDLQRMIEDSLARQYLERTQREHPLLKAHLTFGLPTPDEVFSWVRHGSDADLFYAGDVLSYRDAAERWIRSSHYGLVASFLNRLTIHLGPETGHSDFDLETVPMRRHRRLYLHLRRA